MAAENLPDFEHSDQGVCRRDIWIKAAVGSLCLLSPVVTIGLTWKLDPIEDVEPWDEEVLSQVFLPVIVWYVVSVFLTGRVALAFGKGMLKESNSEVKKSVRNNMTNTGVVLALILAIELVMLQNDFPHESSKKRLAMWYRVLLILSAEACVKGIFMSSFMLVYMEPLNTKSAMVFTIDHLNYLGEPMAGIVLALAYFLGALGVWMYSMDGMIIGMFGTGILFFMFLRSVVVLGYCSAWKNGAVEDAQRSDRLKVFAAAVGRKGHERKRIGVSPQEDNASLLGRPTLDT